MMDAANLTISLDLFNSPTCAASDDNHHQTRRRICTKGCKRPVNVCLCDSLPAEPIAISTRVVILHHPHEQRHKLATVPVLSKCISNCDVIVGRRLRYGDSPTLDSLYDDALRNPTSPLRAIFLFPVTLCFYPADGDAMCGGAVVLQRSFTRAFSVELYFGISIIYYLTLASALLGGGFMIGFFRY